MHALINKDAFTEARLLLLKWRLRTEDGPEIETIEQAMRTVEMAEEKYQEERSNEKEVLETAKNLIEEESFEEAIKMLEPLYNDQDPNPEIIKFRDLAIENLINRERNKAAKIFLTAKDADDPKRKEELLLSSYNILKLLIDAYPKSTLIDKLNSHLTKVRDELEKLREEQG